jgi:hypothetical protein
MKNLGVEMQWVWYNDTSKIDISTTAYSILMISSLLQSLKNSLEDCREV